MEIPVLRIDNEFKHLICPLQRKEYVQLEQNILADGCRDPIVVWNYVTDMKYVKGIKFRFL